MILHWRNVRNNMNYTSPLNTLHQFLMPELQKFKNAKIRRKNSRGGESVHQIGGSLNIPLKMPDMTIASSPKVVSNLLSFLVPNVESYFV